MSEQQLAVFAFDSALKAQEFFTAALRLNQEGSLLVRDAVFVSKDEDGKARVTETTDPSPGRAALSSGVWGLLFGAILAVPVAGLAIGAGTGALMAKLIDTGVPDDFVQQLRETVQPSTTAVALLVSHVNQEAVNAELARFAGAKLISGTLGDDAIARVNEALGSSSSES